MNTIRNRLVAAAAALLLLPVAVAEDLTEAYELALLSDPLLREAEANMLATLETKPQARSALLPQLSFSAFYQSIESEGGSSFLSQDPMGNPQVGQTLFDTEQDDEQWQLQLQQTIFRWDQWTTLKQAGKTVARAEIDYRAAQQDLIVRVALRYFNVLSAKDTLDAGEAAKEAIARQLEQSEKRFEVGLIAITDVQESQAAYDRAVAAVIAGKRDLATAKEFLREITGVYFDDLQGPTEELPLVEPDPQDDDEWVGQALEQNFRLIGSRLGVDIAREEVKIRRAGHYPTLDLFVTHTDFDRSGEQGLNNMPALPGSADAFSETDNIRLQLNFPIYAGGGISSRVREAVYQHQAAKQQLARVARETERQTRDAYLGVISDVARVKSLKQALASSETALRATEAGYEVGTRTTVDVLDGRRNLFQAQTDYAISRYDYIVNFMRLKFAAGTLNEEDIQRVNRWLE